MASEERGQESVQGRSPEALAGQGRVIQHAQQHTQLTALPPTEQQQQENHMHSASSSKKRGPKFGSKMRSYKQSEWKALCEKYQAGVESRKWKTQIEFLRTEDSDPFNESNARAFSCHLKKFKSGEHSGLHVSRVKPKRFQEMEDKLLSYLDLRARLYIRDRCGLSYATLREKLLKWASNMEGMEDFTASAGWIAKALKRNDASRIIVSDDDEKATVDESLIDIEKRYENSQSCIRSFGEAQTVVNEIELFLLDEAKRRKSDEFSAAAVKVHQELGVLAESLRRLSAHRPTSNSRGGNQLLNMDDHPTPGARRTSI